MKFITATETGNTWLILEDAEKPTDARTKSGKYIKSSDIKENAV